MTPKPDPCDSPQTKQKTIPYGHQDISSADIEAVVAVLRSDWLTQGPSVDRFEAEVAAYCGAKHAVATANATCALHLACEATGLEPGNHLWTSPNSFVASANCGRYCGATIDFVDIDPRTRNICVEALEQKLRRAKRQGLLPRVLVAVDFAGQPCDLLSIRKLADEYEFYVIEDASHAIGGMHRGEKVGNGRWADITIFSFHPVKILTTGEGGMALTNDQALHQRMAMMRTHGITRSASNLLRKDEGPWYYEQMALGFNYRLTDIQAALGCNQLKRVDEFVRRRQELVVRYNERLAHFPVITPFQDRHSLPAWHLYVIELRDRRRRREVVEKLRASGILVNVHYIPIHLQPYYQQFGFRPGDYPAAETYYEGAISLPLYFSLSDSDQDRVISSLAQAVA